MCMTTSATLTLASMLTDPMIHAMMRSDGVSEHDHAALLFRVRNTLADRDGADRDGADRAGADRAAEAQGWRTGVPSTVIAPLVPAI